MSGRGHMSEKDAHRLIAEPAPVHSKLIGSTYYCYGASWNGHTPPRPGVILKVTAEFISGEPIE